VSQRVIFQASDKPMGSKLRKMQPEDVGCRFVEKIGDGRDRFGIAAAVIPVAFNRNSSRGEMVRYIVEDITGRTSSLEQCWVEDTE